MDSRIKLLSGTVHPELAKKISQNIGVPLSLVEIKRFKDSEVYVKIKDKMRGEDVYIIQPTSAPANESLMELLIMIDAVKRASAGRINIVVPYLGYGRQDRKASAREPITAKLVANLITAAGANRVITVDLHADQVQGFFDISMDHFPGFLLFHNYFKNKKLKNLIAVAPDTGAAKRTRRFAKLLDIPLAIIDKRRAAHNECEVMTVIGEVKGMNAIIIDDIIDTGGTITGAAAALKQKGAKDVYICATHPVLSSPASKILQECAAKEVIVTDTIPISPEKQFAKLKVISIAPLMAQVIQRIHSNDSLGELFKTDGYIG
ncbi:MAG: ribose-phosphate pyrophosphokinase [archaeon]